MFPSKAIWLTALVAVLVIGSFFLASHDSSVKPESPGTVASPAGSAPVTPTDDSGGATAKVQQMIDSGQFAPPPGNPAKMYSIASPFSNTATPEPSTSAEAQGSNHRQQGLVSSWTAPGPRPAEAVLVTRSDAAVVSKPVPGQAPEGEFETPPGIGSAKGGH